MPILVLECSKGSHLEGGGGTPNRNTATPCHDGTSDSVRGAVMLDAITLGQDCMRYAFESDPESPIGLLGYELKYRLPVIHVSLNDQVIECKVVLDRQLVAIDFGDEIITSLRQQYRDFQALDLDQELPLRKATRRPVLIKQDIRPECLLRMNDGRDSRKVSPFLLGKVCSLETFRVRLREVTGGEGTREERLFM